MVDEVKPDNNVRRHIFRLHERIQNKYIEMQKKLEKSRSVGSISNLSDDFSYKESIYSSELDIRETEDEVFRCESSYVTQTVTVEEIRRSSAIPHEIEYIEATFAEIENESSVTEHDEEEILEDKSLEKPGRNYIEIHKSNSSVGSMESLNEIGKDKEIHPHRTIRQRINSRLNAAKEKRKREEKEKVIKENLKKELMLNTKQEIKINRKNKLATVSVALIEATGLEGTADEKSRLLNCRLRLGPEKVKTKTIKSNKSVVKWQELFNINMYDDLMLEVSVFDKDTFIGRHMLDLSDVEREKTHKMRLDLEGSDITGVQIFILLTISGISSHNSLWEIEDLESRKNLHRQRDSWYSLEGDFSDVGRLLVIVYGAKGLISQECYCVLKLGNERLQTHTEYKTYDPNWMKLFTFDLNDITSILEVTVYEEKKSEEVGKVSIPLLKIHSGEKVWYALKDSNQRDRAKGQNPRILLEMCSSWNLLKASLRVINPKEAYLLETEEKLDRRVFARNLSRAKAVIKWTLDALKVIKTCFEWESRKSNAIALFIWTIFCWNFRVWMTPLLLLIPFVKYRPQKYYLVNWRKYFLKGPKVVEIVKLEKEEKSSLIQKLNSLQEMIQSVQNGIGKVASLGESIKNLCNFTVPYVSFLAIFFILMISLFMFIIPLKYIFIGWGIHKFTRKILRPNRIPNSEILDLLSRVPDDETLLDCEELPLEITPEEDETKIS
ncbi:multiple C2 and transmembrane domain-containing protein-like [Ostrinia furnacalis]|uniref:multiple C2 and transmembrane domain-containing protein-like n=1 Tax=Ostrinia furnacalis TaxID=93504 RepID=UPI0010397F92|nr:multiple C2 and transmembrane domain-containing protein-like [Ostrinia furnacalis]